MHLERIAPHPLLKNYIEKMWVFESDHRISDDDIKLIVPSGRIKLILPTHGVSDKTGRSNQSLKGESIALVGITDIPRVVHDDAGNPTGTIGIEFTPHGAYRFFRTNYNDLTNKIFPLADVLGNAVRTLEYKISDRASVQEKIALMERFLIKQFSIEREDSVFEYSVNKIKASRGKISIKELERETGYSSRWLNMKFLEKAGVSPKNLSSIIRFHEFYKALTSHTSGARIPDHLYQYYYDQSHFIKDFKRFTGLPPSKLIKMTNDFGKIFSKD